MLAGLKPNLYFKLSANNIGVADKKITIPYYMAYLLR